MQTLNFQELNSVKNTPDANKNIQWHNPRIKL